jgi:transposase-like protein
MHTRFPDPNERWTDEDARAVLEGWRRSDETIAAFSRKDGLVAERLYWWRKRLTTRQAEPTRALVPSLVAATIVPSTATVTIRVAGEVAIEVGANASPSWIAAIVVELARSLP